MPDRPCWEGSIYIAAVIAWMHDVHKDLCKMGQHVCSQPQQQRIFDRPAERKGPSIAAAHNHSVGCQNSLARSMPYGFWGSIISSYMASRMDIIGTPYLRAMTAVTGHPWVCGADGRGEVHLPLLVAQPVHLVFASHLRAGLLPSQSTWRVARCSRIRKKQMP